MNCELWSVICDLSTEISKMLFLVKSAFPGQQTQAINPPFKFVCNTHGRGSLARFRLLNRSKRCYQLTNLTNQGTSIISTDRWMPNTTLWSSFQYSVVKPKPSYYSGQWFTKYTDNPVNQSELKEITCSWCKAWENTCEHVNHNWFSTFGLHVFISYIWMKNWCKMLKQLIYCVV